MEMTDTEFSEQAATSQPIEPVAGTLSGILDWTQLDQVWQSVLQATDTDWYLYKPDEPSPNTNVVASELQSSIESLNQYLRESHPKEYCGIVYVDSISKPTLIKIFDPVTLTSICNIYGNIPAPGWVISNADPAHSAARKETSSRFEHYQLGNNLPSVPKHPQATDTLDARCMGCPLPLVQTARSLKRLAAGEILQVISIEPGAINDIESLCNWTGHKHLALAEGSYGYSFFVQRK